MRVLYDTSVLVAVLTSGHPQHHKTRTRFIAQVDASDIDVCVSTHALAELFAVLTRFPHWRISPSEAKKGIDQLRTRLTVVALDAEDYLWVLERIASLELSGAVVYDTLHARAALTCNASKLYTLNSKDFVRLGSDVASLVEALN